MNNLSYTDDICLANANDVQIDCNDLGIAHLMKAFYGSPSQYIYKFPNTIIWKYMKYIEEFGEKTNYKINLPYFKTLLYDININNINIENTLFQHIRIGDIMQFFDNLDLNFITVKDHFISFFNNKPSEYIYNKTFDGYVRTKVFYNSIISNLSENVKVVVLVYSHNAYCMKKYHTIDNGYRWTGLSILYIKLISELYKNHGFTVYHINQDHTHDQLLSLSGKMKYFAISGGGFSNLLGNMCLLNNGNVYPIEFKNSIINDFNRCMIDPQLSYRLKLYEPPSTLTDIIKLNIGCGKINFGNEWEHIDGSIYSHIKSQDIVNLPYKNDSVDIIYCSHTFEYFDRSEALNVLTKWKNVLKDNGGVLRLAVPNYEMYCKLYIEGKINLDQCIGPLYGKWKIKDDHIVYHKTTYDFKSLKILLEQAGFINIKLWNWRDVDHGKYDDYSQSYIPHMDKENGTLMSLNVECIKSIL